VGKLADLVAEYSRRLQPIKDRTGREEWALTFDQFQAEIRRLPNIEGEIIEGLRMLVLNPETSHCELWIQAASERPTAALVSPLCQILSVRNRYMQHEWVAEILGELKSPASIDCLRDACSFAVEGDVFRSLAKKCLGSLAAIGTASAIAAIKSQISSPWPEVRREAERVLDQIES